jgi:hypothetical protein
MKCLILIKHAESLRSMDVPKALHNAMGPFIEEGFRSGWLKDTNGLKGSADAVRIRSRGGKLITTDGPFTEAKEIVGGYAMIDVPSRERAVEVTREFVDLHRVNWPEAEVECELRPLDE